MRTVLVAILAGATLFAQAPAFDVASVKPSDPNAAGPLGGIPIVRPPAGGRFIATNVPLRVLVRVAYGLEDVQIVGGPSWQLSQKFDINATSPDATTSNMNAILPMLKTLLADRFKLKAHTETREMPIYTLVVTRSDGKLGPEMKPSTSDCANARADQQKLAEQAARDPAALAARLRSGASMPCSVMPSMRPGAFGMRGNGQPIATLTRLLTGATGRIVQDKTGLTGLYDWNLTFDPQVFLAMASQVGVNLPPGAGAGLSQGDMGPALMTAIQEQLGLKLESARAPVETLVIDSAEMPEAD